MKKDIPVAATVLLLLAPMLLLFLVRDEDAALVKLDYRIVGHERLHVRMADDRRYSIWTDDDGRAQDLARSFGLAQLSPFKLSTGQILVAFINDRIQDDLVQISYNPLGREIDADYADSGIMYKLRDPGSGKKYSSVTLVVFTPPVAVGHYGLRCSVENGLSEKMKPLPNAGPEFASTTSLAPAVSH